MGASLAYYALFSLFPLLLVAVTAFGFVLGQGSETRTQILASVDTGAPEIRTLVEQTLVNLESHRTARGIGAIVGLIALVVSASAVFGELDASLNTIWRCHAKTSAKKEEPFFRSAWHTVVDTVRQKLVSMTLVLCTALLLLASLAASTVIDALTGSASQLLPVPLVWQFVEPLTSIAFLAFAFAALFKTIPDCKIAWKDVLPAGALTAVAFTLVKRLLTYYLTTVAGYSAYGAVGAVLALLTWIYLVSLIVFFGAEFSRVYAERHGSLAPKTMPNSTAGSWIQIGTAWSPNRGSGTTRRGRRPRPSRST
jgi:membrane protein